MTIFKPLLGVTALVVAWPPSASAAVPISEVKGIEFVLSPTGDLAADRAGERYQRGRSLALAGDHAAALEEYLWCFDVGMARAPIFQATRLSVLLTDILRLADAYPPAQEALLARVEAAETRLVAGNDVKAGPEYAALCMVARREERLLATFAALPADDPRRPALGYRMFQLLHSARRYADALTVVDAARMNATFEARIQPAPRAAPADAGRMRRLEESRRDATITSTIRHVEVLAGAGELVAARALAGKLLAYDRTADTLKELNARLADVGRPDLMTGR